MNDQTDAQLLQAYAACHSEPAFAELVRRHLDFVHSAAMRMVCDSHLAEDVSQATFAALARNAFQLKDCPVLPGWLHQTAQNIAAQTVRTDVRRRAREQEAAAMNDLLLLGQDANWEHIAPHLDAAIGELNGPDRDAVLLRYFKNQDLRTVGATLGISDDAAQKRVGRAVERLREFFAKRGITVGASGLAIVISANAVQAAPVGLAITISTAAALTGTTLATATTATAIKTIAMTTLQKTVITATLAIVAGVGIYEARKNSQLSEQNQTLQQQQAPLAEQIQQLRSERDEMTNMLTSLRDENERLNQNQNELLTLRGNVGVLRLSNQELGQRLQQQKRIIEEQSVIPAVTEQSATGIGEFFPKESWRDVGNSTPENASKTYFWAMASGDGKTIAKIFVAPIELTSRPGFNMVKLGFEYTDKAKNHIGNIKAIRVAKYSLDATNEANITIELQTQDGKNKFMPLTFQRFDDEWKIKMVKME